MGKRAPKLLFALVPLVLVGAGFGAGYLSAVYPAARQIHRRASVQTLGAIAGSDAAAREGFALAYLDPARALAELDGYSYSVPTTPAPFLNYVPRPGTWDNAHIDARGMRDPEPLAVPKPAGTRRVFLVGGSTAYGSGAPGDDATVGAFLERALAAEGIEVEVRTFASPAWTSTHERIAIEHRVRGWEPDLVIALSGANDTYWSQFGHDTLWQRTYEDSHFYALLEATYERAGQPLGDAVGPPHTSPLAPPGVVSRFAHNAAQARRALGDVPYLIALQPVLALSEKPLSPRERAHLERAHEKHAQASDAPFDEAAYWRACFDGYAQALSAAQVEHVDLRGVFDERGAGDEVFLDALHFGDRGNQWIAEALVERAAALLR
ncbi:MAG: SGNH/GDSL hydrolase family protein [Planctomycetota bacterium]